MACTPMPRRRLLQQVCAALLLPQSLGAAPRAYELLAQASRVQFNFLLAGLPQQGSIPVREARIRIDLADLHRSAADISLDAARARTGLAAATEALRGPAVLDAARHPVIRFRARRFQPGAAPGNAVTARITGDLTLRGATRPLLLHARFQPPAGAAPLALESLEQLDVHLSGRISRAAYGAGGYSDLVADRVGLAILARLRRTG